VLVVANVPGPQPSFSSRQQHYPQGHELSLSFR
jgi:hypothetical protein